VALGFCRRNVEPVASDRRVSPVGGGPDHRVAGVPLFFRGIGGSGAKWVAGGPPAAATVFAREARVISGGEARRGRWCRRSCCPLPAQPGGSFFRRIHLGQPDARNPRSLEACAEAGLGVCRWTGGRRKPAGFRVTLVFASRGWSGDRAAGRVTGRALYEAGGARRWIRLFSPRAVLPKAGTLETDVSLNGPRAEKRPIALLQLMDLTLSLATKNAGQRS